MLNEIELGQLVDTAYGSYREAGSGLKYFPALMKKIISNKAWEKRVKQGKVIELSSLRDLIIKAPIEGWGEDPAKIEALIKDDAEALTMWREAMQHQGERNDLNNFVDNVNEVKPVERSSGNSRSYTVARLKRQAPELFEKVVSGELSANAAAVQAGFRKVKTPLENLEYWWRKASEVERAEFLLKVDGNP